MAESAHKMSSFRKQMAKQSARTAGVIKEEAKHSQFLVGSHTKVRLRKALAVAGRLDLAETTLLTPAIHKIHADRLAERYLRKWQSVRAACHNTDQARARFRFLTLLDCIEVPDPAVAIRTILAFKEALSAAAQDSVGIWLLGAVEVEMVSLEMMRENRKLITTDAGEMRKLDVCEQLLARLPKRDRHLPSYLLIHFHGVVSAVSEQRFDQFEERLRSVKRWSKVPRGIELKRLSGQFGGKKKSMETNLKDIARYITKGGNDWVGNRSYLRYKLSFDGRDASDEATWVQENWRNNELLRQEHKEEGIEDALSLNHHEVACLADVIDRMMKVGRGRMGYLLSI
jgi:hypothetical protein